MILTEAPAHAQRQESLLTGNKAGLSLGKVAQPHRLVSQSTFPLRINLLPIIFLDAKDHLEINETEIFSELKKDLTFTWKKGLSPSKNQELPDNLQIMDLSDQEKIDLIINAKIQPLQDGFWLILSYFSGADGKVVLTQKYHFKHISEQTIVQSIQTDLAELKLQNINDVSDDNNNPGEIHLRTSPEDMHVYLNGTPVGQSPLILRYLPLGEHELRLVEESLYQVKRLQIVTDPPGVSITINRKKMGITPVDLPPELLGSGEYHIAFESKESFQAEIRLQTTPENVPVQLNGSSIQRTPISFQKLSSKEYQLNILPLSAVNIRKKIVIDSSSVQSLEISAYKYAKLILNTSVNNVRVEIDHEYQGETPYSNNLSQGQHLIHLKKNRYRDEEILVTLQAGKNHEIFLPLKPRSTDTSIFLTPTAELTPQFNLGGKFLTFGHIEQGTKSTLSYIYGMELDYGWPKLYRLADSFELGLELSGFFFALHNQQSFTGFQGLGAKLQFLQENDSIPISAALGTYLNFDLGRPLAVGYLSLSRNFGDFALHMGLQTHGFNLNLGYTGWDDLRLGALIYSDSFFRLLAKEGETSTTFYGLQAGYSF